VIEQAGEHLRELRVAEVVDMDMVICDGKVQLYRTKSKSPSNTRAMAEVGALLAHFGSQG